MDFYNTSIETYRNINIPTNIALTVTHKCNLRCSHCFNNSEVGNDDDMTDEELIRIAKECVELSPVGVCLCGGEPILRGDVIYEIIEILKGNVGSVNIVSNGYATNESILRRLKDSGIDLIQFSLDGTNPIEHDNFRCRGGSFDKVIQSIILSKKVGLDVGVSFVPNKLNHHSIKSTINLCRELGVNIFRVMPMIPMGRGAEIEHLCLNSDEYIRMQQILEIEKLHPKMIVEWGDPIDHLVRMPINAEMGFVNYGIEIRYDGKVTPSSYLPIVIGDLKKESLVDLWYNKINNIWNNKDLTELTSTIENIYDFDKFSKRPFSIDGDYYV
ncbi:radical SAM protein [Tissierella praeacuta]|uniref:radical SAM/SPASM domain-containing protein n=1 Tax=Tissierella praeacuta TaxID=43131 RepID=UPI002FDA7AF8